MALAQLGRNLITDGSGFVDGRIDYDGTIHCKNIYALNIDGETYTLPSIDKLRELEMRINVLENHIKAQEALKDKYIIVLGE